MKTEIKKWGNSAALRLPSTILAQAHLDVASKVEVTVEAGRIVVQPAMESSRKIRFPFTEAQLLQGLDADNCHFDELVNISPVEWEQ
nr:AbrB/MazE/SpoVT family DNA-binding domain-containing protein [uncultured Halomonas sp.]